jgi:hypothetical protein
MFQEWLAPRKLPGILTAREARAAVDLIMNNRAQHFIHLDTQGGPLPFFTYGSYWGYLNYDPANRPTDPRLKGRPSRAGLVDLEAGEVGVVDGSGGKVSLPERRRCMPGRPVTSDCLSYSDAVEQHRERLLQDFGFLYDRVCARLSEHMGGQPVMLLPSNASATPGFQIWLAHQVWSLPVRQEVLNTHTHKQTSHTHVWLWCVYFYLDFPRTSSLGHRALRTRLLLSLLTFFLLPLCVRRCFTCTQTRPSSAFSLRRTRALAAR